MVTSWLHKFKYFAQLFKLIMIQRGRNHKTQVSAILNPVDGYRDGLKRKGQAPKNHINDNSKSIKKMEKEFKMKEKEDMEAKRESTFKMKKFTQVQSRVYNYSKRPSTWKAKRNWESSLNYDHQNHLYLDEDNKENINSENIYNEILKPSDKNQNFIVKNIKNAWDEKSLLQRPQTAASEFGGDNYRSKGKIPQYLIDRKEEWKQVEVEKKRKEDLKKIPPGTKLLPEEERLATLDQLKITKQEIENTLESLPISMRTMALRNKKLDLESKLKEVEAAILLFSKENVFVAI